jgi:hypothetical protein
MSSYNPPIYYFSGIGFNSAFYNVMTTGLTQSQANALYLQKTTPDTATAVETFSSGILTTKVDVSTSGSNMDIATGSSSGNINIATAGARTGNINIGSGAASSGVITIGSTTSSSLFYGTSLYLQSPQSGSYDNYIQLLGIANSLRTGPLTIAPSITSGSIYLGVDASATTGRTGIIHIGDGNNLPAGANIHINNGTTNASTTNIMNGTTTSGTCNIMTGTTSTGIVNIATGSGSSSVNISNGTSTGTVNIGNGTNAVNINSSYLTLGTGGKILQVQVPIVIGYDPFAIYNNTLGYNIKVGPFNGGSLTGGVINLTNITLTVGIWLVVANALFVTPGANAQLSISSTSASFDQNCGTIIPGIAGCILQVTRVVDTSRTSGGIGPWYLVANSGTTTTVNNILLSATRIA